MCVCACSYRLVTMPLSWQVLRGPAPREDRARENPRGKVNEEAHPGVAAPCVCVCVYIYVRNE